MDMGNAEENYLIPQEFVLCNLTVSLACRTGKLNGIISQGNSFRIVLLCFYCFLTILYKKDYTCKELSSFVVLYCFRGWASFWIATGWYEWVSISPAVSSSGFGTFSHMWTSRCIGTKLHTLAPTTWAFDTLVLYA